MHFTHFYNEATGNRFEKAQATLHGVGVSVIGGAVSTAAAAIPLMTSPPPAAKFLREASLLALQPYTYIRRCGPYVCICSFRGISNQMRRDARMMHLESPMHQRPCTCPHAFTI